MDRQVSKRFLCLQGPARNQTRRKTRREAEKTERELQKSDKIIVTEPDYSHTGVNNLEENGGSSRSLNPEK